MGRGLGLISWGKGLLADLPRSLASSRTNMFMLSLTVSSLTAIFFSTSSGLVFSYFSHRASTVDVISVHVHWRYIVLASGSTFSILQIWTCIQHYTRLFLKIHTWPLIRSTSTRVQKSIRENLEGGTLEQSALPEGTSAKVASLC